MCDYGNKEPDHVYKTKYKYIELFSRYTRKMIFPEKCDRYNLTEAGGSYVSLNTLEPLDTTQRPSNCFASRLGSETKSRNGKRFREL